MDNLLTGSIFIFIGIIIGRIWSLLQCHPLLVGPFFPLPAPLPDPPAPDPAPAPEPAPGPPAYTWTRQRNTAPRAFSNDPTAWERVSGPTRESLEAYLARLAESWGPAGVRHRVVVDPSGRIATVPEGGPGSAVPAPGWSTYFLKE